MVRHAHHPEEDRGEAHSKSGPAVISLIPSAESAEVAASAVKAGRSSIFRGSTMRILPWAQVHSFAQVDLQYTCDQESKSYIQKSEEE